MLKLFPIFFMIGFLTITEAEVGHAWQQSMIMQLTAEVSASDVTSFGATAAVENMPNSVWC